MNTKENPQKNNSPDIEVEGEVTIVHPNMRYTVAYTYQGLNGEAMCYVSGKMRKKFIEIKKGDKVKIVVTLPFINNGIIVWRLTERQRAENQPAA
jgi:translation initiation factor IF-1